MKDNQCKYYHETYFRKIAQLMKDERFEEAISNFENYITSYPKDLNGNIYYAICHMKLGDFSMAEKILSNVLIDKGVSEHNRQHLELIKVHLLSCQERYEECYELLKKNLYNFKKNEWTYLGDWLYIKKQLGILNEHDYEIAEKTYLLNQVISYDETSALSHIEKHLYIDENNDKTEFIEQFPLNEIFYKIKAMLPLEEKIYDGGIANKYTFKYTGNGHVGSTLVDYIRVITLRDTNEIITMYPSKKTGRPACFDLTPTIEETPKQKRLSQIEKFNQRYGNK